MSYGDLRRAIVPSVVAAAVAGTATAFLERDVLHSDTHGVVAAVALLALATTVFLVIYLGVLRVLAPVLVKAFSGSVRRRLSRSR